MVLLIVFATNQCGGALEDAQVFGLPDGFLDVFLGSGIFMILVTACVGQLSSQVNASHCMLDFIDNHFMTFTLYGTFTAATTLLWFEWAYFHLTRDVLTPYSHRCNSMSCNRSQWITSLCLFGGVPICLSIRKAVTVQ
jgi:hypothetical protein